MSALGSPSAVGIKALWHRVQSAGSRTSGAYDARKCLRPRKPSCRQIWTLWLIPTSANLSRSCERCFLRPVLSKIHKG